MADMWVEIEAKKTRFNNAETGRFEWEVTEGCRAAARAASAQGAATAAAYYGATGLGWALGFPSDENGFGAVGQWAEAAEFGIPPHLISTEKYSLYNPEEGFPSVINERTGKPIQVKQVNHPGTPEVAMVRSAGDEIAYEFGDILDAFLP